MDIVAFLNGLKHSDARIANISLSIDPTTLQRLFKVKLKEPFNEIKIQTVVINEELLHSAKTYAPYIVETVRRSIDEIIIAHSYELVKKAEIEKLKKEQEAATWISEESITQKYLDGTVNEAVKEYQQKKSDLFQKLFSNKLVTEADLKVQNDMANKVHDLMKTYSELLPPPSKNYNTPSFNFKHGFTEEVVDELAKLFPEIKVHEVKCPVSPDHTKKTIANMIVHLNDNVHNWTRDQVADWLETLDVKLEIKEKL